MSIATLQPLPLSRGRENRAALPWPSMRSLWLPFVMLFVVCPTFSSALAGESPGWQQRCAGIRTSYNPQTDLRSDRLTLEPTDPRWPAFLSWIQAQQIATSMIIGRRTSSSPDAGEGIAFRWASGTPWEQEVVLPFGQTLAHLLAEREWRDLDFPQFFTSHGGIYGINLAERLFLLDPHSLVPWRQFFEAITAPSSPSAPLLSGWLSAVAPDGQSVSMTFGENRIVAYSAARLLLDLRLLLSDCSVYSFFQLYDQQYGSDAPPSAPLRVISRGSEFPSCPERNYRDSWPYGIRSSLQWLSRR